MSERALVSKTTNQIQTKRRAIQLRREKEYALSQYKKMSKRASSAKQTLASKEPVSINHAVFFTVCLGVASIVIPQLGGLAIIFSILILGQVMGAKFDLFEKKEEVQKPAQTFSDERMLRMVKPEVVKLSSKKTSKKRLPLPVSKAEEGLSFKDEDGGTVTQFDWRQLTQ